MSLTDLILNWYTPLKNFLPSLNLVCASNIVLWFIAAGNAHIYADVLLILILNVA